MRKKETIPLTFSQDRLLMQIKYNPQCEASYTKITKTTAEIYSLRK